MNAPIDQQTREALALAHRGHLAEIVRSRPRHRFNPMVGLTCATLDSIEKGQAQALSATLLRLKEVQRELLSLCDLIENAGLPVHTGALEAAAGVIGNSNAGYVYGLEQMVGKALR